MELHDARGLDLHPLAVHARHHQPGAARQRRLLRKHSDDLCLLAAHHVRPLAAAAHTGHDVQRLTGQRFEAAELPGQRLGIGWAGRVGCLAPALCAADHARGNEWQFRHRCQPAAGHALQRGHEAAVRPVHRMAPALLARVDHSATLAQQISAQ
jgi:hypothetical protein